jgi:epsilon-lactone hydrolase
MGDWTLPPLRAGHPPSEDLVVRRARAAGGPAGETAIEEQIGGVRCLTVSADDPERTILYLHGGGYRMGRPEPWVAYARRLAVAARARIVLPDYRLAPEHPFPAGLHDVVSVYRALGGSGDVWVAGDSAGAGLAAALALAAHEASASPPGLILVSPMLDLTAADETYDSRAARDPFISRASVLECADLYLQGYAAEHAAVSPLFADPAAFPATLILVGGEETLLGETLAMAGRLALADRRVTLHVAPGMGHVWPMLAPDTPDAGDAIAAMAAFVAAVDQAEAGRRR